MGTVRVYAAPMDWGNRWTDPPAPPVMPAPPATMTLSASQLASLGVEIRAPHASEARRRLLDFARSNRRPVTWRDPTRADEPAAAELVAGLDETRLPLVRLPGGMQLEGPSPGQVSRALGIG